MDGANGDNESRSYRNLSCPLVSFILPVYNAAAYLTQCLDQITQQPFRDIEIIAVDGASTDDSVGILEKRKLTEDRLTVIRENSRIGPGNARNLGAQQARGEYLWFVDADDVVIDGCMTSIEHSLKVASPDVLLVGYEIIDPRGRVEVGPVRELSDQVGATCFTAAEFPRTLNVGLASWNKIVRRSFLNSLGAEFSSEWPHEDVRFSCQLLLHAAKLSFLDQTCYRYSKDIPGSSMATGEPRRHFRVFDVWEEVLAEARRAAEARQPQVTTVVYRMLFERAIGHCSTQLDSGGWGIGAIGTDGYVARRDRREFFGRIHRLFVKFAPSDYIRPPRLLGVKFDVIRRGYYWLYVLLDPVNKVRNAVKPRPAAALTSPGRSVQG